MSIYFAETMGLVKLPSWFWFDVLDKNSQIEKSQT